MTPLAQRNSSHKLIPTFCFYLHVIAFNAKIILVAMDAISAILAFDNENNAFSWVQMVDESGGLDSLEQLQEHENRFVMKQTEEYHISTWHDPMQVASASSALGLR